MVVHRKKAKKNRRCNSGTQYGGFWQWRLVLQRSLAHTPDPLIFVLPYRIASPVPEVAPQLRFFHLGINLLCPQFISWRVLCAFVTISGITYLGYSLPNPSEQVMQLAVVAFRVLATFCCLLAPRTRLRICHHMTALLFLIPLTSCYSGSSQARIECHLNMSVSNLLDGPQSSPLVCPRG